MKMIQRNLTRITHMNIVQVSRVLRYNGPYLNKKNWLNFSFELTQFREYSNSDEDHLRDRKVGMAGFVVEDTESSYKNVSVLSADEFYNPQVEQADINKINAIHDQTIKYKYNTETKTISIPSQIEKMIENMIFSYGSIKTFKLNLKTFIDENLSHSNNIIKPISKPKDANFYIASQFHRDYASNYQALAELKQKITNESNSTVFNPKKVLNVTNGPATGIIALHELMKDVNDYHPSVLEAFCLGNEEMTNKAKMLLSTYRMKHGAKTDTSETDCAINKQATWTNFLQKLPYAPNTNDDLLNRKTLYDLIILEHALVSNEDKYTADISKNIKKYVHLLAPKGHLVLIEKGNPFGFEVIAQARENIIKPEKFLLETGGKIPRPHHFLSNTEITEHETQKGDSTLMRTEFYYSILGPCSHHGSCPLQLYNHKLHHLRGKAMKSCTNQKKVMLPKYMIELTRGKINMHPSSSEFNNKGYKRMVSGRENKEDFAIHSYSYLLVERTSNDPGTIAGIEEARKNAFENKTHMYPVGSIGKNASEYPRIMNISLNKRHVDMALCAPSGKIEKWSVGKSKLEKTLYKDLKNANKNDCWPHDSEGFSKKVSGRAESKSDYLELKRFLIALKKEENKLLHEELTENLKEMNNTLDNGGDVSIEDKLSIEIALRGLEESMENKTDIKSKFTKTEYKKALSFIKKYKELSSQDVQ